MFASILHHSRLRTTGLVLAAIAFFALAPARAADGNAKVLAAVKFPSLKTFTEQVMNLARVVYPGQQTEMMPMLFLGAFGYPSYPGVSATDPVTVFFFEDAEAASMPFVIMARMQSDSMTRAALTRQPDPSDPMSAMTSFGLTAEDRGGWTLLAKDPANLALAGDPQALAKLTDTMTDFDITVRMFIGPEMMDEWTRQMKQELEDRYLEEGGAASDEALASQQRYVDFLATIGKNLEYADLGLDLGAQTLSLGGAIQAIEGTPEYQLLSATAGGKVPVADFVSAAAPMIFAASLDKDAVAAYYDSLEARAMKLANADGQKLLQRMGEVTREYFAMVGNGAAGSLEFSGENPVTVSVGAGKMTNDKVVSLTKIYYDEILPEAIEHFKGIGMPWLEGTKFELKPDVAKAAGLPVNEVIAHMVEVDVVPGSDADPKPTGIQTEESYFAIVGGNVVTATDVKTLEAVAAVVKAGQPVADSVASRLTLASGQAFGYACDMKPMVENLTGALEPQTQAAKSALKQLAASDLAPLTGTVTLGKGKAVMLNSLPVSTLTAISNTARRVQQAESEASGM